MSRRSSTGSSRRAARADGARILHLDAFSGVAGNMFVAALLDAGLARRELEAELAGLGLDFKLRVSRVRRGAIAARYLDVLVAAVPRGKGGRARYVSGNAPARPASRRRGRGPGCDRDDHAHDHDHDHH
ncbi:MAG: DUF111 family protein, partial [Myxococcales bacterium]|nr:DUF111 family protein [Myxococcales bacterium]